MFRRPNGGSGIAPRPVGIGDRLALGGSGGDGVVGGDRRGAGATAGDEEQDGRRRAPDHCGGTAAGGDDGVGRSVALGTGVGGGPFSVAPACGVAPGASGASPMSSSSGGLPS